ncbi:MAG: PDZ domain-containing protein [Nitriliruptorales bacterium]|nr:PDZ domain-containing protein [Nitriliruptorales bacterium]
MLRRLTAVVGTAVLLLGLLVASYELGARGRASSLPEGFEALSEVYDRVSRDAVNQPPDDVLVEGAIEGMLESLDDAYAEYYDADEFAALNDQLDGMFVGIGVVLEDTEVGLTVQTVLPGSPAEEVGLEPGEQIVRVDGTDVRDTPSGVVIDKVRGPEGSSVVLGLMGGSQGAREVTVVRAQLNMPTLESRALEGEIGYIALRQFTDDAGDRVQDAVEDLLDDGSRALVLDLRGNPGGYLPEAVAVAGVFLSDEEVVRVGVDAESAREYRTGKQATAQDVPLAVLVDRGSASASEIVAGAVQDLERGEIVGTTTFGKGTVQTISVLGGDRGLKYTTARYFTPSGNSIDGRGVTPDLIVESRGSEPDEALLAAQESLTGRLAGAVPAGENS